MGNYKFRLSDMIPNAWFHKLRDMERARNHHHHKNPPPSKPKKKQPPTTTTPTTSATTTTTTTTKHHHHSLPRKSYHFTRNLHPNQNFQDTPRNIPSKPDPEPVHDPFAHASPVRDEDTAGVSSATVQPQPLPIQEIRLDCLLIAESPPLNKTASCSSSCSSTCSHGVNSISGSDTVVHADQHSFDKEPKKPHSTRDSLSQLQLPPIATKPKLKLRSSSAKQQESNLSAKEQHRTGPRRRSPAASYPHSPGVKLKTKSPRLLAKMKLEGHARKSSPAAASLNLTRFGNSFAVVKSSSDPARDFRESMVEMIVENNIKGSKELEELLTCYLSLNSDEYHQVIVDVFKQIWFDLSDLSGLNELINY
ncbi:LOW QUALITY PROTEIN: transcription repressor OFP1-like [Rhodamnia argentea]|uniref:Transcription repressor n=1 Tax=Rhodamnia argentea TaxID=178133 RepID=A0A8B8Q489_9MYRT|nr:LOW QUALITY PROTEIN: transcription repressor OFP1-like [Rhodamnia argentea]